jgi:hypothetical protein
MADDAVEALLTIHLSVFVEGLPYSISSDGDDLSVAKFCLQVFLVGKFFIKSERKSSAF